jgi:hypothetical protein
MPSRRQFLRACGATAATIATAGVAAADHREPYEEQPEYVDLVYDEGYLREYQPYVVTRHQDVEPSKQYGWVATNTERGTDMLCYWNYYVTQYGITPLDSHESDREPIYVEVDSETGDVEAVHVDGYHYLLKSYPTSAIELKNDRHPLLYSVDKWHFFRATSEEGEQMTLTDMHEKYGPWLDNDWKVHRKSVVDPWGVKPRGHWWKDSAAGVSVIKASVSGAKAASSAPFVSFGGAEASDL